MITLYSAAITGNPGNCSYPHRHDVVDADSLKAAVCHDYVCAEYKNHYRNNDNFIGSDCLPVDCDNDHSEAPLSGSPRTTWPLPFRVCALLSITAATTTGRKTASLPVRSSIFCSRLTS